VQPDEFLRLAITDGRGRMPSFSSTLTEEQVGRLVGYLRREQTG
jgi:mono/diheme cytochrome c family protein